MVVPSSLIKILGKSVQGLISYDRADKQRLRLFIQGVYKTGNKGVKTRLKPDFQD